MLLKDINKYLSRLNLKTPIQTIYKDFYNVKIRKIEEIIKRLVGAENDLLSSFSSINSIIINKPNEKHRATIPNKQKNYEIEKKKKGGCLIF